MSRKYQHTMELLPQIKQMLADGMTQKEVENALGLTGYRPVHALLKRERKKETQGIHHCGFGTSAATLVYGIPSVPVPHVLDQLGFAMQLNNVNVATKPLKAKDLSEETIMAKIKEMHDSYDEMKRNAETISERIKTEGGVGEAVRLINELIT